MRNVLRNTAAAFLVLTRDRDILDDDMRRLRDYREHHDQWEHR